MNVSRFTMSRPGFPGIIIIVYDKIGKGAGVYRTSVVSGFPSPCLVVLLPPKHCASTIHQGPFLSIVFFRMSLFV